MAQRDTFPDRIELPGGRHWDKVGNDWEHLITPRYHSDLPNGGKITANLDFDGGLIVTYREPNYHERAGTIRGRVRIRYSNRDGSFDQRFPNLTPVIDESHDDLRALPQEFQKGLEPVYRMERMPEKLGE